ncbi:uncharacterized protein LOC26530014 [Drosophila willistoni]|uniref:uncharacterized protein LOC26530014 n=1 Tax=Drosophila willistoni TaxID=7260 RepID=UPI001F07287B|nr:uncharacterized protein LOC26530014 [Drosophila willistoni]
MTSFANGIRFYVNPKAKYLSNAVENVLYNIGKSDRSSLAWQTCRTNQRSLNNRRLSAQHDMVPLTRRVSSILKVPGWKRDEVDKAERRKNIFYQMLKASQDIADDNKISPILRPNCVTRQNGGMVAQNMKVKDDRIFNEIYDKLKGWLNKPTNVAENSFLLLNSSSIYKQPIAKDQDENIFRPYPEVPVYKVHHKKKIITKSKPRGTRKVKKPSVALSRKSKKRKSLKFRATVQFGKTVTGRRSHTGSQTESIVGLQQSRSAISRVFDSTVLIPKLDNNSKVPAVRNGIEPRANQISPKTLAYEVNERLASEETVYSIPLASQRKMEESTDVSKFNILRSPRTSSESELSKGSQKSHSSFHHSVRTFGSRKVLPIEEERTSQQSINSVLLAKSQQFMSSKKNAATSGHKSQRRQNKEEKPLKSLGFLIYQLQLP